VPTNLPIHERNNCNLTGMGADAWAGLLVVLGLLIVGTIYWSGHTNDAHAAGTPASQTAGVGASERNRLTPSADPADRPRPQSAR
jgi:hypothetical protein